MKLISKRKSNFDEENATDCRMPLLICGGWSVVQRRVDGAINFRRKWRSDRSGFGDLSKDF